MATALHAFAAVSAAARLEYRGGVLTTRQVEGLAAPALRAPGDSLALAATLRGVMVRLEAEGHLDARAVARWEGDPAERLVIEVTPGPRLRLAEVRIESGSPADSERFARALALAVGNPASPGAVRLAMEKALGAVVDQGFPYAAIAIDRWETDSAGVHAVFGATPGPRVVVSRVRFPGLVTTRPRLAEKAVGRLTGLPYNRTAAEAARERLMQLGLFRTVTFEGLEGEADRGRGQLVYRVEEPPYNRFEGVVGVQGDGRAVGTARLDLGNLLGTGRALGLSWDARGPGVSSFGARYAEPFVFGAPLRLEGALEQQVQDTLFVRTRWGARAQFTLAAGEKIEAGFEEERVVQTQGEVEEAGIQHTTFALERSGLDDRFDPRRGTRVRIGASQSFKRERTRPAGARKARGSAAELQAEWHRPLRAAAGLSFEVDTRARFSSERVLPLYERYPLGGAAGLRGHDEEEFRVDRYLLTRLEWRRFLGPGGARAFGFWDHAWTGTRRPDGVADRLEVRHEDGIGFGLELDAAGGRVGIAYGLEPGRPPLEGKIHLRLVTTF